MAFKPSDKQFEQFFKEFNWCCSTLDRSVPKGPWGSITIERVTLMNGHVQFMTSEVGAIDDIIPTNYRRSQEEFARGYAQRLGQAFALFFNMPHIAHPSGEALAVSGVVATAIATGFKVSPLQSSFGEQDQM